MNVDDNHGIMAISFTLTFRTVLQGFSPGNFESLETRGVSLSLDQVCNYDFECHR